MGITGTGSTARRVVEDAWVALGQDPNTPHVAACIEKGFAPIAGAAEGGEGGGSGGEAQPGQPVIGEGVATVGQPAEGAGNGNGGGDLGAVGERMNEVLERIGGLEQRLPQPAQPQQPQFDPNDPLAGMPGIPGQQQPGQQGQPGQQPDPQQLAALQAQQQGQQGFDPNDPLAALQAQQQGMQPQQQFDQFGNPLPPGTPGMSPELGGGNLGDEFFQQQMQAAAQQMVAPLAQQTQQLAQQVEANRREQEAQGLLEDYPELKEQDAAQAVVAEAQQWAKDLGNPNLAGEPGFVELVHLAAKTVERAKSENPAGGEGTGEEGAAVPTPVSLEQPGGSPPQAAGGEPSEAEKIKGAVTRHPIFG